MKFNRKDFLNAKNHIIEIDEWIAVEENDLLHHTSESQQTYSFVPVQDAEDQEIIVVKKETIDINPEIFQAILYEAPMSITRLPRDQYPKGDGWQLLSDQDKEEPKIDPRWEKLNDFKLDDD